MPSKIKNNWTLRNLILNTKKHLKNRFEYAERDFVKFVRISRIRTYGNKPIGEAKTKFRITSRSYPQYTPYYTGKDKRGRTIKYQRTYKHEYDVTIQLDKLSIDVPFKGRTGSDKKWDFNKNSKAKTVGKGRRKRIIESKNVKNGINGDFFFRCEYVWKKNGILYGRDWTNGPPKKTNPKSVVFADKHFLTVVQTLVDNGILQEG